MEIINEKQNTLTSSQILIVKTDKHKLRILY